MSRESQLAGIAIGLKLALKLRTKAIAENWMKDGGKSKAPVPTALEAKIAALGVGDSTKTAVADILIIALGKKINKKFAVGSSSDAERVITQQGLCIVPLRNDNGHDYALNNAVLCWTDYCCITPENTNGKIIEDHGLRAGNSLGTKIGAVRLATEAEIKALFKKLVEAEKHSNFATSVTDMFIEQDKAFTPAKAVKAKG
jgi:hypothetical protein